MDLELISMNLALYTFGVFARPAADPVNDGFHARDRVILPLVERAAGFVARSGYAGDPGPASWGEQVFPDFYAETGDGWSPSTLSLWRDIPSAMAFSYGGRHAEALKHGRAWFVTPAWPPYAAWWVEAGHRPTWTEAVERHRYLHEHGPTARAFSFKAAFDPEGAPVEIDAAEIRRLVAINAAAGL